MAAHRRFLLLLTTALQAAGFSHAQVQNADKILADIAHATTRPDGAPKFSDVCFSSRDRHPTKPGDPHDTFRDAALFHATRLDWVYSTDPAWIAECKARGYFFGGALNTILSDSLTVQTRIAGRIKNEKGELLMAPWMRPWKIIYWGCANSPEYRATYLAHGKLLLDAGADALHMDDPDMNAHAPAWGGCWCEYCQKKARERGVDLHKNMKSFQQQSMVEFYTDMRRAFDEHAGRHVPFSSNNFAGRWSFPYALFDYGIAEIDKTSPAILLNIAHEAERFGKAQILTLRSNDTGLYRRTIATAYACGLHVLVPYDVYLKSNDKGSDRLFGSPGDYADLFGFIRANAGYLNGYEEAASTGTGIEENRFDEPPMKLSGGSGQVCALARAKPGQPTSPVVIHLVDWGEAKPFHLKLHTTSFARSGNLKLSLLTPAKYDPAAHADCERAKHFAPLTANMALEAQKNGDWTEADVPALAPWGMLIVAAAGP